MMIAHQPPVQFDILPAHPDVAAPDFPVFDQPAGHVFRGIDGNRKADSLRRQDHGRVDADHFPSRVDQRAA